jgi:hypothetical protein
MLARVPIQVRLALAFTSVAGVVLALAAVAVRSVLASSLDSHVTARVWQDSNAVGRVLRLESTRTRLSPGRGALPQSGIGFAQLIDARGRVLLQTPGAPGAPVLDARQLARAAGRCAVRTRRRARRRSTGPPARPATSSGTRSGARGGRHARRPQRRCR